MSLLRRLAGLRSLFRKQQVSEELDEEFGNFVEMATEDKMRDGMTRAEAVRAVRLERGSVEVIKQVVYAAGWESVVDGVWRDILFGFRSLKKSPGFSAVVVLTLTLGIGANTAVFSAMNAVLLKSLPVEDADRVAYLNTSGAPKRTGTIDSRETFPYTVYDALRHQHGPVARKAAIVADQLLDVLPNRHGGDRERDLGDVARELAHATSIHA